ncbi:MAG: hypothetical protein A2X64_05655 [Ignavibacteria bacterium GWF2_33_9]|nr:MAG: hypothetical protein A2X64_05655 [Ignavibacteria bacterium GWF2_33_9]
MKISLINKNAIIGGSSQGIGEAIAHKFAESGANLLLLARNEDNLKKVISGLPRSEGQFFDYAVVDFSNLENLQKVIQQKKSQYGKFHIVVNNTGGPKPAPAHKSETSDYTAALQMHLLAYHTILQEVVDDMKSEKFGRIINITSVGAKQPVDNLGVSNAVRGAVSAWSKTLSRELGPHGITVNNILPGYINTERLQSLFSNISERTGKKISEVVQDKIQEIPAGRLGNAEEIASAACFLASDFASYVNGINFPVDGGLLKSL